MEPERSRAPQGWNLAAPISSVSRLWNASLEVQTQSQNVNEDSVPPRDDEGQHSDTSDEDTHLRQCDSQFGMAEQHWYFKHQS